MERFTVGLFVVVFPLWLLEQHGADPAARGRALAAFLLPFAFLQLGTYRLARRFGPFALLAVGCAAGERAFRAVRAFAPGAAVRPSQQLRRRALPPPRGRRRR